MPPRCRAAAQKVGRSPISECAGHAGPGTSRSNPTCSPAAAGTAPKLSVQFLFVRSWVSRCETCDVIIDICRMQVPVPLFLHEGKTTCCMQLCASQNIALENPRKYCRHRSSTGPPASKPSTMRWRRHPHLTTELNT
eukprot:6185461-Amphidinium_carterae.1